MSVDYGALAACVSLAFITAVLIWSYRRPGWSLPRILHVMGRPRAGSWAGFLHIKLRPESEGPSVLAKALALLLVAVFGVATLACLGMAVRRSRAAQPVQSDGIDTRDYEIRTNGQEIRAARKRPATMPQEESRR
jgi:hypothetical protein